jgi:hypothetical protein
LTTKKGSDQRLVHITSGEEFSKVIFSAIKSSPSTITVPHPNVPVPMTLEACSPKSQHQEPPNTRVKNPDEQARNHRK